MRFGLHGWRLFVKTEPDDRIGPSLPGLLSTGLIFNFLLMLPAWWRDGAVGSLWLVPEAWLAPALIALIPTHGIRDRARALVAVVLALAITAGFFNALLSAVLGRPLNLFLDLLMLRAGFHLIDGSLGRAPAVAAVGLLILASLALVWLSWRLLPSGRPHRRGPAIGVLVVSVILCLPGFQPPATEPVIVNLVRLQAGQLATAVQARRQLVTAAAAPAFQARALPGLAGRDVYLVFVESYGMAALEQARYVRHLAPELQRWQAGLDAAGLKVVSGRLEAPIRGGQSWLAHATVLSGLRLDSQLWYRTLLEREIGLLTDDFRATGHTTITVAPAITREWPEGAQLGFDQQHTGASMGYAGPALGWVTMPDQYTLFHLAERVRPAIDGPVFAQVALISSHWPWTPVIDPLEDWASIGHGDVFHQQTAPGRRASGMWRPVEQRRRDYAESLAYSLAVTFAWAPRYLPDNALLIVLGDHQATSLITGRAADAAVPVHVISNDGSLLEPFIGRGFTPGLVPRAAAETPGMERLRPWLRAAFGPGNPGRERGQAQMK